MYSVVDPIYKVIVGCLPMHFGEMDHLPYRHTQFMRSSCLEILQISSFFLMADLQLLHASVMQLLHDQLSCSYLREHPFCYLFLERGFSHWVFSFTPLTEIALYLGT